MDSGELPPDVEVDLELGPLALVWVKTKVICSVFGFNSCVFNKFFIIKIVLFCKQV